MSEHDWAVSERDVLDAIGAVRAADGRAAVATIVDVEGSAFRRPGAKMLVREDGSSHGLITAGCIEDEVMALVQDVIDADEPRIETYDLMEDDDVWGLGIGCNGIIDVLVEPLSASYDPLGSALEAREPVAVLTVLEGTAADGSAIPCGTRAYLRDGEVEPVDEAFADWIADGVVDPARSLLADGKATVLEVGEGDARARVFVDGLRPAPRLLVLGSGPDVGPVVDLGHKNGFRVDVVSFRGAVDVDERFPMADGTHSTTPADLHDAVALDDETYAVVMTHNFIDDRLALEQLVDAEVPYVGLMGPRDRFEEMLEEFADEGRSFVDDELDRIYTPIGLNLGSGSPYGIATSILAEVIAVHNDRPPVHLSEREGPIHDRPSVESPAAE